MSHDCWIPTKLHAFALLPRAFASLNASAFRTTDLLTHKNTPRCTHYVIRHSSSLAVSFTVKTLRKRWLRMQGKTFIKFRSVFSAASPGCFVDRNISAGTENLHVFKIILCCLTRHGDILLQQCDSATSIKFILIIIIIIIIIIAFFCETCAPCVAAAFTYWIKHLAILRTETALSYDLCTPLFDLFLLQDNGRTDTKDRLESSRPRSEVQAC